MAQYPQGVTDFIPDYQAYQPDFNFMANTLQLKQSQYDQNWNRLNNIYGQILNAPLTHDQSIEKRNNTFKRIDFDLKRVTGLDLSLEQNVQQATQLFRPFYEDASLIKDMAWTKNTADEKAIGTGKRYSTDEKIRDEAWDGGLRAIDYKIQEFKALDYDQLPGFSDVKYTPYVNTETMAMELANKLKFNVKRTTPQGDWIVTEKNGEQIIAPLQAVFYNAIGKDPKVREFYATSAYLKRKDWVGNNKDNPEFAGNAEAAEKSYLNTTLTMLKKQTELTKSNLLNQKTVNENMITKIEQSIANGTDDYTTKSTLARYQEANENIAEMLKQSESDDKLITDNINKTLTTTGGSKLDLNDMEQMRSRVDAVISTTSLQGDLDSAAGRYAMTNYEKTYDPNPFAVQRQKFQQDSSLIAQRIAGQKDVALFKYQLDMNKAEHEHKLKSDLYMIDPATGKLKVDPDTGDFMMKPELSEVQAVISTLTNTAPTDPTKASKTITEIYQNSGDEAKQLIVNVLKEMNQEGVLANSEVLQVLKDDEFSGFNMKPFFNWMKDFGDKPIGTPASGELKEMLKKESAYTTSVEKEMMFAGQAGGDEANALLNSMASGKLKDVSPTELTRLTKRLTALLEKKSAAPGIRNSTNAQKLIQSSYKLDDYAAFRKIELENKKARATEVVQKLKADGFNYAQYMYNDNFEQVSSAEEFLANVAFEKPDDVVLDSGMSWGGFWNTVLTGGAAGGVMGAPLMGVGAAPGMALGAGAGALGYATAGILDMIGGALWGSDTYNKSLTNANKSIFGNAQSVGSEFDAMRNYYNILVEEEGLQTPLLGIKGQGSGQKTSHGSGVTIVPGIFSPTYDHFLEVKNGVNKLNLYDTKETYVSFDGVSGTPESSGDLVENAGAFKAIWADFLPKTGSKMDEALKSFQVVASPIAGGRADKVAIQLRLPETYMSRWKPTETDNGIWKDKKQYNDALKNGITVITDATKLQNVSLIKNAYQSPEQLRIENSGGEGVTYEHPFYPGIKLNYRVNDLNKNTMAVTTSYPAYTGPGQEPQIVTQTTLLSNQGKNIEAFRNTFFSNEDISGKQTAGSIMREQTQIRRQYGD